MRKFLIYLLIFFKISYIYCQDNKHFEFQDSNSDFILSLDLYKNGIYYIDFAIFSSDDIVITGAISVGKYFMKGDSLILIDELTQNKYLLLKSDKKYIWMKGFNFLMGREFELSISNVADFNLVKKNYEQVIKTKKEINNLISKNNGTNSTIKPGLYLTTKYIKSRIFYLVLNENGDFLYIFDRQIVLRGTWKTIGNLLIMKDKDLPNPFYLQIKNDKELFSLNLPGCIYFGLFIIYDRTVDDLNDL